MSALTPQQRRERARNLRYFTTPKLWPTWPFLPVIRRSAEYDETECGLLYDARGVSGLCGHSATVFLCNLFLMPPDEVEFLALPKVIYDLPEEMLDDGWTVD